MNSSSNGHASPDDDDDELLFEVDVQLHRTKQSIYLFQYPLRPSYRPYDEASFTNARIKEKYALIEMDLFVDAQSTNYYAARGKQLADSIHQDQGKQFFNSDRMDKQTIATSNSLSGEHYFIGLFDSTTRKLILCPLKSIVQLRPQFAYLDPVNNASSSTNRDGSTMDDDAMNASDGEQSGSESEETKPDLAASLVTMKFAKKESEYHKKKRLQSYGYYRQLLDEDRWQDLVCIMNTDSFEAQRLREEFLFNERVLPKQEATEVL